MGEHLYMGEAACQTTMERKKEGGTERERERERERGK